MRPASHALCLLLLILALAACGNWRNGATARTMAITDALSRVTTKSSRPATVASRGLARATATPSSGPRSATAPDPTPATDVAPVHLAVSGRDSQTTDTLALNDGLAIFHLTYHGSADFSVVLRDERGEVVDELARTRGPFDGSAAVGLADPCDCVLQVQTDGDWSVVVDQSATLSGPPIPVTLRGSSQAASSAFRSPGGLVRFHLILRDPTGGRVTLLNADGEVLDLLGEGDVALDRSRVVELEPGTFLLQVDTNGPWTVDISGVTRE